MVRIAVISLVVGLVAGWVGQRSRFCSIGGIRDLLLTRSTALLGGMIALFVAAWVLYPLIRLVKPSAPPQIVEYTGAEPNPDDPAAIGPEEGLQQPPAISPLRVLIFLSGIGLGFVSLLVDGCPFRQHVLAGQGLRSAQFYLVGFYIAALTFEWWGLPVLRWLF